MVVFEIRYIRGVAKISVQGVIQQKFNQQRLALKNLKKYIKSHKNLKISKNF